MYLSVRRHAGAPPPPAAPSGEGATVAMTCVVTPSSNVSANAAVRPKSRTALCTSSRSSGDSCDATSTTRRSRVEDRCDDEVDEEDAVEDALPGAAEAAAAAAAADCDGSTLDDDEWDTGLTSSPVATLGGGAADAGEVRTAEAAAAASPAGAPRDDAGCGGSSDDVSTLRR